MNRRKNILIVDDDPKLVLNLQYQLEALGFGVYATGDGSSVLDIYHRHGPFSVIVLDVHLQNKDGFTLLNEIREIDGRTGILMLTARNAQQDKIRGLKFGADDYLCKPFNEEELIMRISRIASRSELIGASDHFAGKLSFGPFTLDKENLTLHTPTTTKNVTVLESDLLSTFIIYQGKVLSRRFLLHKVWGVKGHIETRTVDNFIVRLRRLVEADPSNPQHIINVRGRGYKLVG
ncbi:MAG: response regulator transcription factor [Proteobacteria bacterium]|nr:response regulator transcription factor [Pseudomonadota bacterium]